MILIAHRGFAPENRMSAFRQCINNNVKAIEFDVRLSKDIRPVIIHDSSIKRVTKQRGYVSKLTTDQLAQYDIPTLENVLELFKPVPTIHLYVEIKDIGKNNNILAEKVVSTIESFEMMS
jgi:glycerophosphoryl diester phosphodiesterase